MKNKLWLFQLPVVALFTAAYLVTEAGLRGELSSPFWADRVYPNLQRVSTLLSDAKFKVRGSQAPRNKIVVVEVDNASIEAYGRWPWHRDRIAQLIDGIFDAGAKTVGLDMVFSEEDPRVPAELKAYLGSKGVLPGELGRFETDHAFGSTVFKRADRLVLGTAADALCAPARSFRGYREETVDGQARRVARFDDACPVSPAGEEVNAVFEPLRAAGFEKFALQSVRIPEGFDANTTPVWTALTFLGNIREYTEAGMMAGYFNAFPDQDHVIRRSQLMMFHNRKLYPSLALQMALSALDEKVTAEIDGKGGFRRMAFAKSGREIPVNWQGSMEVNFRGPSYSFPYVSATELLPAPDADAAAARAPASDKLAPLKDAHVLVGVSATGVFDMRAFPTDSNAPGVEGHANILDNLLSNDMLVPGSRSRYSGLILALMLVGAMAFAYAVQRLESIPALLLAVFMFAGAGFADFKVAFNNNIQLNSSFFYLEYFCIFFFTLAAKYVIEERSKKFVRSAFAKYVAPAVVDSILKDPEKLVVGGIKRDLTIMFSDIRSFTTFSERMDAKALAAFLNDYLGIMTKIVFAHEGTLDKYIGDAIMAFWGAPLDQARHAANACKGAVAMMKALRENKARWLEQYGVDVNIGVGINSGPVNVGNMGSSDNFAYTVIGDHVNLSSRLEGLTKAYGVSILTTRFTFDEIQKSGEALPAHRVLDHVKVKGKKNAVELVQVLDRPMASEGLATFEEARQLYLKQDWDRAIERFREASSYLSASAGERDEPCAIFVERCEEFKKSPPGPDWDGSWEMHSK